MKRAESWMLLDNALAVVMTVVVLAALFYSYPARADADKVGGLSVLPIQSSLSAESSQW